MKQAAGVLLRLPDGRIVLQRRTKDAPVNPGRLGFFGGGIEAGETPEQAARRELKEETNLPVSQLAFSLACEVTIPGDASLGHQDRPGTFFTVLIPDMHFAVYEGQRAEAYTVAELKLRDDLSSTITAVLQKMYGEKDELEYNRT